MMAVQDIRGYKPHTDHKIEEVNRIKDAENALGLILKDIEDKILQENTNAAMHFAETDGIRLQQIRIAKERLKEASMWACRSVFRPEEKY